MVDFVVNCSFFEIFWFKNKNTLSSAEKFPNADENEIKTKIRKNSFV